MKTKNIFNSQFSISGLMMGVFVLSALFMSQNLFAQDKKQDKQKGKETVKFYVEDMTCKNCQAKVEKNIAFEKGVTDLKCNLSEKTVEVTYKTDKTNPEDLKKGFKKIGMNAVKVP